MLIALRHCGTLRSWLVREDGQDLIEYPLIVTIIVIVAAAGMVGIGGQIGLRYQQILTWLISLVSGGG